MGFGAVAERCDMPGQDETGNIRLEPALSASWFIRQGHRALRSGRIRSGMPWKEGCMREATVYSSRCGLPCQVFYGDQIWDFTPKAGNRIHSKSRRSSSGGFERQSSHPEPSWNKAEAMPLEGDAISVLPLYSNWIVP